MGLEKRCRSLLIKSLRPIPQELNEIDWKVGLTSKTERLKKHLSAFSNLSGGGFLIFGVNNQGIPVGIDEEQSRQIADILANMARTSVEPQISIKFITFKYEGASLLGVYIEESFEKPVHIRNKGMERSYIRAGGQSRQMSKEEIRRSIMSSRSLRFGEIIAALPQEILENWEEYFDFSEVLKRMKATTFTDLKARNEYLASLKLLSKVNERYVPTNLAVLSCAVDFSKLPSYERFAIRLIEYSGNSKLSARRDFSFTQGYSLSLDKIIETISDWLPQKEVIVRATRKEVPVIPVIALREIIVNAIIHRDYTKHDSMIMLELYNDRIEITNPGGLVPELSIDRIIDHPSVTRNEVLSDFMRKLDFAEERGSGIDKAVIEVEAAGLPPIYFSDQHDYFKATIFIQKSYRSLDKNEKIYAIFQHACLNAVIHRKTTVRTILERFKLSSKASLRVQELIDETIKVGKLKLANPQAAKRDQYYLPYWL